MPNFIDLTGKTFGHWFVIKKEFVKNGKWHWKCKCDCGKIKSVDGGTLRSGLSISCGCNRDLLTGNRSRKHGGRGTRLYSIWKGMRKRCFKQNDTSYKNYGGRGITICKDWNDFSIFREWSFKTHYSEKLTIDRIDNNGNYEPNNCRWTTQKIQANNTRKNHWVVINRKKMTITDCARIAGITPSNILSRISRGYSGENLLKPSYFFREKKFVIINGVKYSVNQLSEMAGVDNATIYKRLEYGFNDKKLLMPSQKKELRIKLSNGKKYTARELSNMSGIKIATIYQRINRYGFKGDDIIKRKKWAKKIKTKLT